MNMKEKTAYIKGLMEGIEIDCSKPEGKLIKALAEVVDSMASEIETIKENVDICNDYIEEIDEDLFVFGVDLSEERFVVFDFDVSRDIPKFFEISRS